jgi:hypothetical protein
MFVCKYCYQAKWLPATFTTAVELKELMHKYGYTEGYQMILDQHPRAKIALAKLENIRLLAGVLGPEEFAKVADIMRKDEVYGRATDK